MQAALKNKAIILPGDTVCLTKVKGIHQDCFRNGNQFIGKLSDNGITVGKHVVVIGAIETSSLCGLFISHTCMIVRTKNSVYLIEKL